MQSFFTKKVSFDQRSNIFFFIRILFLDGDLDPSFTDDEECVTSVALSDDVVSVCVVAFFQDVRYFDQRFFWQGFEYRNTKNETGWLER